MKHLWACRRTFIATVAVLCLTACALGKGQDTALAIAAIVASIAGANAYQKVKEPK